MSSVLQHSSDEELLRGWDVVNGSAKTSQKKDVPLAQEQKGQVADASAPVLPANKHSTGNDGKQVGPSESDNESVEVLWEEEGSESGETSSVDEDEKLPSNKGQQPRKKDVTNVFDEKIMSYMTEDMLGIFYIVCCVFLGICIAWGIVYISQLYRDNGRLKYNLGYTVKDERFAPLMKMFAELKKEVDIYHKNMAKVLMKVEDLDDECKVPIGLLNVTETRELTEAELFPPREHCPIFAECEFDTNLFIDRKLFQGSTRHLTKQLFSIMDSLHNAIELYKSEVWYLSNIRQKYRWIEARDPETQTVIRRYRVGRNPDFVDTRDSPASEYFTRTKLEDSYTAPEVLPEEKDLKSSEDVNPNAELLETEECPVTGKVVEKDGKEESNITEKDEKDDQPAEHAGPQEAGESVNNPEVADHDEPEQVPKEVETASGKFLTVEDQFKFLDQMNEYEQKVTKGETPKLWSIQDVRGALEHLKYNLEPIMQGQEGPVVGNDGNTNTEGEVDFKKIADFYDDGVDDCDDMDDDDCDDDDDDDDEDDDDINDHDKEEMESNDVMGPHKENTDATKSGLDETDTDAKKGEKKYENEDAQTKDGEETSGMWFFDMGTAREQLRKQYKKITSGDWFFNMFKARSKLRGKFGYGKYNSFKKYYRKMKYTVLKAQAIIKKKYEHVLPSQQWEKVKENVNSVAEKINGFYKDVVAGFA